jgi:hypothetical protein
MLSDLLPDLLRACAAICAVSTTLAVLKACCDYLRGKTFCGRPPTLVQLSAPSPTTATNSACPTVTFSQVEATANAAPVLIQPARPAPVAREEVKAKKPIIESVFPPLTRETGPGDPGGGAPIECGNCRKRIESPPVTERKMGNLTERRYKCEHCNALVSVKI